MQNTYQTICGVLWLVLCHTFGSSMAQVYTWQGSQGNQWHNANNWSPPGLPGMNDSVVIAPAVTAPLLNLSDTIGSITVLAGARYTTTPSATLTVRRHARILNRAVNNYGNLALAAHNGQNPAIVYELDIVPGLGGPKQDQFLNVRLEGINTAGPNTSRRFLLTNGLSLLGRLELVNAVVDANSDTLNFLSSSVGTAGWAFPNQADTSSRIINLRQVNAYRWLDNNLAGPTGGWMFLGSPLGAMRYADFGWDNPLNPSTFIDDAPADSVGPGSIWIFDNQRTRQNQYQGWVKPYNQNMMLPAGQGARVWVRRVPCFLGQCQRRYTRTASGNDRLTLSILDSTEVSVTANLNYPSLNNTPGPNHWNLIANPFPGQLSWEEVDKRDINNAYYVYRNNLRGYAAFVSGIGQNGAQDQIANGQAFFVQANPSCVNCKVVFRAKQYVPAPSVSYLRKTSAVNVLRINMTPQGSGVTDETVVRIIANASKGFDPSLDARKLPGTVINAYTLSSANDQLSINAWPEPGPSGDSIVLGMQVFSASQVNIKFTGINSFGPGCELYIRDKFLGGPMQALNEGDTLGVAAGGIPNSSGDRFVLYVFPAGRPTQVAASRGALSPQIYPNPASTVLNIRLGQEAPAEVSITDVLGRPVLKQQLHQSGAVTLSHLPGGYYQVVVEQAGQRWIQSLSKE